MEVRMLGALSLLIMLTLSSVAGAQEPTPPAAPVKAPAPTLELKYKLSFNMDSMGDQLCPSTGFCDCTAEFRGAGSQIVSEGTRRTFEGTWTVESNDCNANLSPWFPSDGKAFHTLRLNADATAVDEWVVHQRADAHQRLTSGMKEGEQYWIAEMAAPLNPQTGVVVHTETESQRVQIMTLTTVHSLQMMLEQPTAD